MMPGCTECVDALEHSSSTSTFIRSVSDTSEFSTVDPMEVHPEKSRRQRGWQRQWRKEYAAMKNMHLFRAVVVVVAAVAIFVFIFFIVSIVAMTRTSDKEEIIALKERTAKLEATVREITTALYATTGEGGTGADDGAHGPRAAAVRGLSGESLQREVNNQSAIIEAMNATLMQVSAHLSTAQERFQNQSKKMKELGSRLNGFYCLNQSTGENLRAQVNNQSAATEMMKATLMQVSANLSTAQERFQNQSKKMEALESLLNRTSCLDRSTGESMQREIKDQSEVIEAMNFSLMEVSFKLNETSSALSNVSGRMGSMQQRVDRTQSQASDARFAVLGVERTVADLASNVSSASDVIRQSAQGVSNLTQTVSQLTRATIYRSCRDYLDRGFTSSGIYTLVLAHTSFHVYCDMDTDGGGWLVFQRRQDGSVDFYRNWAEYQRGFGSLQGEFWLGNEKLKELTSSAPMRLRVDMEDWSGNRKWAEYSSFSVSPSNQQYMLRVSGYSGNAGDALGYNNGQGFTTLDVDHDNRNDNCAVLYHGAFWHKSCHKTNPNGRYGNHRDWAYMVWENDFHSQPTPLKTFQMKLR